MGVPVRGYDDGQPSRTGPKNEPPKDTPKNVGAVPSNHVTEIPDPPWRRKPRGELFEGDVAAVELRSRLALRSERIPEPEALFSMAPTSSGVLRLVSGVVMAAAVAGVAGYFFGFKASTKMAEPTPASSHANVLAALSTPAANLKPSNRDYDSPTAARAASVGLAPVDTRGTANPVTSADTAQRPARIATPPQT